MRLCEMDAVHQRSDIVYNILANTRLELFFFSAPRRPPSTPQSRSSAASDVYKGQGDSGGTRGQWSRTVVVRRRRVNYLFCCVFCVVGCVAGSCGAVCWSPHVDEVQWFWLCFGGPCCVNAAVSAWFWCPILLKCSCFGMVLVALSAEIYVFRHSFGAPFC